MKTTPALINSRRPLIVVCLTATLFNVAALAADNFEKPPTLSAAQLSPGTPLRGTHYQVNSQVPTDGFLTHYSIQSDFGDFRAIGPGQLDVIITEINAIATLNTLTQDDQLLQGAKASAGDMINGVKSFVDKPTETIEGIPDGIGRFFKRSYRNIKTGVQKVQDRRAEYNGKAPAIGPGAKLPGGVTNNTDADGNIYVDVGQALGRATVDALGFDEDRRRLARELGVDPYTTNPVLDKKLNKVTWAAFVGNFGVDIATAMIPGGVLLSSSQRLSDWVYNTPPGDLRLAIEKNLLAMGASRDEADHLLRHRYYPLSLQAALVAALKDLDDVVGRDEVMPLALTVASEQQARYLVETLRMLGQYHHKVKPLQKIEVLGTVIANTKDGERVVVAPVDYLSWNPAVAGFLRNEGLAARHASVYLAGAISNKARAELQKADWQVHDHSKLFVPIIPAKASKKPHGDTPSHAAVARPALPRQPTTPKKWQSTILACINIRCQGEQNFWLHRSGTVEISGVDQVQTRTRASVAT